ncbi:MAG: Holliday junction branch migration protein RuvA [Candidatus Krumholzibacteriota bacterium]|nr:Holliday junction branch migration protein RuvA [Candidatus Krumholzibacteriota bacterium]
MIASIEGILAKKRENGIVIEVGGLGIDLSVSEKTISTIGEAGERVRLVTWLYVREDQLSLFGFRSESERKIFLALIGVSGIGPKVAMGILSAADPAEIAASIHHGDSGKLVTMPGIGKKTAERLILELKDKIDITPFDLSSAEKENIPGRQMMDEALAALVSIGLNRAGAKKALDDIDPEELGDSYRVEDIVRIALKRVAT